MPMLPSKFFGQALTCSDRPKFSEYHMKYDQQKAFDVSACYSSTAGNFSNLGGSPISSKIIPGWAV